MTSDDLGIEDPGQTIAPASRSTPTRGRALLAGALILLLVLGLIACGYLGFRLHHPNEEPLNPFSGAASVSGDQEQERSQATATAQQFALRMDDVDGTKFDSYVKGVDGLLTTKAKAKNKQAFDALRQAYTTAKVKGTGKVLLSGIADLDSDSATVLVAHDASITTTQGAITHHYRWNVELVKVGGKWLVDDFNPVN